MPLDPTLSEECFRNSVKKYFVDGLQTTDGIYIDFATIYKIPKVSGVEVDKWVSFSFDGCHVDGNLGSGRVAAYMFTRRDDEGDVLGQLRDALMAYVIDETMTDGHARAPLYDLSWSAIGGMVIQYGDESTQETAPDGTIYKYINLYFRYAVK